MRAVLSAQEGVLPTVPHTFVPRWGVPHVLAPLRCTAGQTAKRVMSVTMRRAAAQAAMTGVQDVRVHNTQRNASRRVQWGNTGV